MTGVDCCRRCTAALDGPVAGLGWPELDGEDAGDQVEGPFPGRLCTTCGWNNVAPIEHFYETDLARLPAVQPDLSDTDDRDEIERRVRIARSAVCSALRDLVLDHPDRSRLWLLGALAGLRGSRSTEEHHRVLDIQQVYACLLSEGPIDLDRSAPPDDDTFAKVVFVLTRTVQRLSDVLHEINSGTVAAASLRDGVLRLTPSADFMWMAEVNLSRPREANPRYLQPLLHATDDVERRVYGASATDLLGRLAVPAGPSGVTVVDLASPDPAVDLLRRHAVLTAARWRSHLVPSFFSADPRRGHRTAQAMVVQAAEADWLACTPLLDGRQAGEPVGITSPGLVIRAAKHSAAALSGRLHLTADAARWLAAHEVGTVRAQARSVHDLFEREAATELIDAGLPASTGLQRMDGRPLPCGEIDLVAGCIGADGPVVVIGECKNVDFTFFKDLGMEQVRATLGHASAQARRKADWAARAWRRIVRMLALPDVEPVTVAVVVTRTIATPADHGVPVLGIVELVDLARVLRERPASRWRGDLRAGIIRTRGATLP